jgi:hypothetical protein
MLTVLNILGLRFTNRVLESVLDSTHVASVDILLEESLGLEGRAGYYDRAGALVDMMQSHALHVLSFLAMEPPSTLNAQDLRDNAAAVLRATRVCNDDPAGASRRARYTAGRIGDRTLPTYVEEPGVDAARDTETLAEVTVEVNTWRWAGVPFRLRAGKALPGRTSAPSSPSSNPTGFLKACAATSTPIGSTSVWTPRSWPWTSTSTAREIPEQSNESKSACAWNRGTSHRTGRCWPASSPVIPPCPCAATKPSRRGASSNRCCTPGSKARSRWRST